MAFGLGALLGGLGKVGKGIFGGIKRMPGMLGAGGDEGGPPQLPGGISEQPQTLFDKLRTPDFNPNIQQRRKPAPIMAPAPRPSMPTSVPDANIPGGRLPVGPIAGPRSRAEEMQEARDVYRSGPVPQGFGARLKSAIVPAITGALRGYAQTGDAGGAIGGLLGGGGIAALSPKTQRAMDFEQQIKPQILERYSLEDQQAQADAAARREALDQEYKRAQIGEMARKGRFEQDKFEWEKTKPGNLRDDYMNTPGGLYDLRNKNIVPGTMAPEKPAPYGERYNEALGELEAEGWNPEQSARDSLANRRESIIDALPEIYKQFLRTGQRPKGYGGTEQELKLEADLAFNQESERQRKQGVQIGEDQMKAEARRRASAGRQRTPKMGSGQRSRRAISVSEAAKLLE